MTPQEIQQIIDMLIEKLGPIGGQVWSIYVRQVYVHVVANVALGMALLLCGFVGLAVGYVAYKRRAQIMANRKPIRYDDIIAEEWSMGLGFILGSIALALGFVTLLGLVQLLNPEYYAIQLLGR
jgi:uncharacterized membrane protein YidH (DUF202 family)